MDYISVTKSVNCEITEKKSKFIAYVCHVETENEAQSFIEKIRKLNYDATHNVYAYVLKTGQKKYSDDKEPSKTAGYPILDMIENENITDVVCVVTRYFGGTLLGVGGLIRAYTKSAKEALKLADISKKVLCDNIEIFCEYEFLSKIEHILKTNSFLITNKEFSQNVKISVISQKEKTEFLINSLTNELGLNFKYKIIGEIFN